MSSNRMNNIAGTPVEGKDFFGRKQVIEDLLDMLQHDDVLLLGPRRIGKTSLARRVMAELRHAGWRSIEVNVAACKDELGFLGKLNTTLDGEFSPVTGRIKQAFTRSRKIKTVKLSIPETGSIEATLDDPIAVNWIREADDVARRLKKIGQPILIYLDELPLLLLDITSNDPQNGKQRIRRFLDWFRHEARNQSGDSHVRWLVSGSIGLDTLVQQYEMSDTLHGFQKPSLEAFHEDEAIALLGTLAESYSVFLSPEDSRAITHAIGWPQPYYLQFFFNKLRSLRHRQADLPIAETIEHIMNNMIQPDVDNDFHYWQERLEKQLHPADARHCLALLDHTAQTSSGGWGEALLAMLHERLPGAESKEAQLSFVRLRDILIRDAYWQADDSSGTRRYRFRLEPLRRWWARRNSL